MAGTRAPFASLAALAAVASGHAEQPAGKSVEAAKQDLKSLPALQRPAEVNPTPTLFPGTAGIPGLSPSPSAGTAAPAKKQESALPAKSANWLLDGMNQLEAESKAQQAEGREVTGTTGEAGRNADSLSRTELSKTATTNPFADYLTQWLSPGDQALLKTAERNAGVASTAPWDTARSDFGRTPSTAANGAQTNALQLEFPGMSAPAVGPASKNPYLGDATVDYSPVAPVAGSNVGRETTGGLPSILTPAQESYPSLQASAPAKIEQARPAPSAPPTERLIDDRKYFPQLRRF